VPFLQVLFIDTWDLTTANHTGGPPVNSTVAASTISFLQSRLSTSIYPWRIVVGHHPIYSAGDYGPFNLDLVSVLDPILRQYKVDAYFAAHENQLEHIARPFPGAPGGVFNYFVVGAGSNVSQNKNGYFTDPLPVLFQYPQNSLTHGGYATVQLNVTHMNVTFFRDDGNLRYSAYIPAWPRVLPTYVPTYIGPVSPTSPSPSPAPTADVVSTPSDDGSFPGWAGWVIFGILLAIFIAGALAFYFLWVRPRLSGGPAPSAESGVSKRPTLKEPLVKDPPMNTSAPRATSVSAKDWMSTFKRV